MKRFASDASLGDESDDMNGSNSSSKDHLFVCVSMDVLRIMLMYLSPRNVTVLGRCDRSLRHICESDNVWMRMCQRDFGKRKRFGKLVDHICRNAGWQGDKVTYAMASTKAGIDPSWLKKCGSRWKSLYLCTPRLRYDGVYTLHQRRISAREQSLLEAEGELTEEQMEESWRPVVRDSYNYIRFFPNGQIHFLIHYLAPERAIPLMMDQALNIHRNDEVSSKLQFYTGSYFFRPRKRNIEIHMFQGRYLVRILLNDVQQECFGTFGDSDNRSMGSTSSSGESDCSVPTSSTLKSLSVEVHDAVIMHEGKPEGQKLVFNLYDPSKNYNFVPFTL